MSQSKKTIFMIDPQQEGYKWVLNKDKQRIIKTS